VILNISFSRNKQNDYCIGYKLENVFPHPKILKSGSKGVMIFGSPVMGGNVNREIIAEHIIKYRGLSAGYVKDIDGEFLLIYYDISNSVFQIANDRFTSIPLYYYCFQGCIKFATKYIDLVYQLKTDGLWNVDKSVFFEFLWFRRLHDEHTYDTASKYLKTARILTYNGKDINLEQYWYPNFQKDNLSSLRMFSEELASGLVSSVEKKTTDIEPNDVGLFLSGGMDTRTILAALQYSKNNYSPTCFTLGYSKQGEYRVAKKLTLPYDNIKHKFIELSSDYIVRYLDEKNMLASGMYNQLGIIFVGHKDLVESHAKVLFHGHGLDYMFQGMYLPSKPLHIFGKTSHFKLITNINKVDNFAEYYTNNVGHRFSQLNIANFLLPARKKEMMHGLIDMIDKIASEGESVCNDNFDLWEYMLIHTISRHYSHMDVSGIGTNGDQRKVANDNGLMKLYLRMPIKYRLYARAMRGALKILSSEYADIESANTGYRINASPYALTMHFAWYKLMRELTGNQRYRHPQPKDRTWPDLGDEALNIRGFNEMANSVVTSELLHDHLPYLDWSNISKSAENWIATGNTPGVTFLSQLISINSFLKSI